MLRNKSPPAHSIIEVNSQPAFKSTNRMRKELTVKKAIGYFLACAASLTLTLGLGGCGKATTQGSAEPAVEEKTRTQTDHIKIESMYANDGYTGGDNEKLKMLYVFYEVTATDENLSLGCNEVNSITIGKNTYNADMYLSESKMFGSYYHSAYNEDIYSGDSLKMLLTFEVPEGDLEPGKDVSLNVSGVPDCSKLDLSTDDIVHCTSAEEVAQKADPDGYAAEMQKREDADANTVNAVSSQLNGYYYTFYVNSLSYRIEFYEPNTYRLESLGQETTGTYSVKKGYVQLTNDMTGYINECPYSFNEAGALDIDLTGGFDVNE